MSRIVLGLVSSGLIGCAPVGAHMRARLNTPSTLPMARVDNEASSLLLTSKLASVNGATLRHELSQGITEYLSGNSSSAEPARYALEARHSIGFPLGLFPCLFVLVYLGCPFSYDEISITLRLQIGEQRFIGTAREGILRGLYQNNDLRAALGAGAASALMNLQRDEERSR